MGDFDAYENQAGGWHQGSQSCILKDGKNHILKPLKLNANPTYESEEEGDSTCQQKPANNVLIPACRDELHFYEIIRDSKHPDDTALRTLMPGFHGMVKVKGEPHIVLDDLTEGMTLPCVADLKIGYTTYYPARDDKQKKKVQPATQKKFGFTLTGMRVYRPDTGQTVALPPNQCKKFSIDEEMNYLSLFCQQGYALNEDICKGTVSSLKVIHNWIKTQRKYIVRTSSILIAYDARSLSLSGSIPNEKLQDNDRPKLKVQVKMIDFAHIMKSFGESDENYILGLENLIDLFTNKMC